MEQPVVDLPPQGNGHVATLSAAPPHPIPNQEAYIARIENTMHAIEEQNLTNDPRYTALNVLRNRLTDGSYQPGAELSSASTSEQADEKPKVLTPQQLSQLKSQVAAYKMLARNEPLPRALLNQVTNRKPDDLLPPAYEFPVELENGEKLPYDLTRVLLIHQQRATSRSTALPTPPGIDPQTILKERENRYFNIFDELRDHHI
ncbi:QLQ domain-containing protein [Ditylenchus destructor]|nr:QLQ domain-containing protein [Ditylenchus destructor]